MLNKKNRLTSNSSFIATYHRKRVVSDEFFVLYAGKNKTTSEIPTKFGFVVSKKIHKRAVVRNKLKRRLREVIFNYIKINNPNYVSLIISAKVDANNLTYIEIKNRINVLLQRIATKNIQGF